MRCTIILACSLVDPTLAFGAVPACTDMDSPSFSALTNELAAEVGLFSPGEWSTVPRLCGICVCGRGGALTQHLAKLHPLSLAYLGEYPTCASAVGVCFVAAIASACPITCDEACTKEPNSQCEPPSSVAASDFSLDTYISARWFTQELVPGPYQRGDRCIYAEYERFEDERFDLKVINYEEDAMGNAYGTWLDKTDPRQSDLCAIQDAATQSQATVGICLLPNIPAATNYHVLFYDEPMGVALVTGEK